MALTTSQKGKLANAGAVGFGVLAGYALTKHFGREDMLTGWGVLGVIGIGSLILRPDPRGAHVATTISAALFSGLVTAAFEDAPARKTTPIQTKPRQVDWEKTYDEAVKACLNGNDAACSDVENLRGRLDKKPVTVEVVDRAVDTPQVSIDPARQNALRACNEGDVQACCYLENVRGEVPPKPCIPDHVSKERLDRRRGLSGYMPGLCC